MERNITTLGIVLHSRRWGQTNRRLKLLSVDLGMTVEMLRHNGDSPRNPGLGPANREDGKR